MAKINFNLNEKLYRNFKKYSVDQKESMTKILIRLIKEELKDVSSK